MRKTSIKRNNGITLIALVITIIVLLILAGVSIAFLTGDNGIITQATAAREKNEIASVKEQTQIDIANWVADQLKNGGDTTVASADDVKNILNEALKVGGIKYWKEFSDTAIITPNGYEVPFSELYTIEEGIPGKYYETDTKVLIGEDVVSIPGGGILSRIDGEYESVEDGVVIYIAKNGEIITDWSDTEAIKQTYDQFVWVPVENAYLDLTGNTEALSSDENIRAAVQSEIDSGRYPMAIKNGDNYFGVLYQFTEGTEVIVRTYNNWTPLSTSSGTREPDVVTSYDNNITCLNQVNGILNTSYSTSTQFKSALQTEYNEMVKSVADKGGFWVGRYETSNMSNSTTTTYTALNEIQIEIKKNQIAGINNVTGYRMYAQQKIYAKKAISGNVNLQSSMIWGSQWDQIMIWMKGEANGTGHYITNGIGMGNYGTGDEDTSISAPVATGNREIYKVRNVYDLAGNVYERTLVAKDTNVRIIRGGSYYETNSTYTRPDFHSVYYPISYSYSGSRCTLY